MILTGAADRDTMDLSEQEFWRRFRREMRKIALNPDRIQEAATALSDLIDQRLCVCGCADPPEEGRSER